MTKSLGIAKVEHKQYDAVTGQLIEVAKQATSRIKQTAIGNIDGFMRGSNKPHLNKGSLKASALAAASQPEGSSPKKQWGNINHQHAVRANKVARHRKVNRFGYSSADVPKSVKTLPRKTIIGEILSRGTKKSDTSKPFSQALPATSTTLSPTTAVFSSHHQLERLLDQALVAADTHKQAIRGRLPNQNLWQRLRRTPRWLSVGSAALVVLVAIGFFAWQNMPNVAMRVAASRSSLSASVPGYTPSGFSFWGPINYTDGSVTIRFKANSDDGRTFSINQRSSSWNSASLLANYVVPNGQSYQTFQNKGATVYLYGSNNNATWIDHGIWYNLESKAKLNADQLLRIAASM